MALIGFVVLATVALGGIGGGQANPTTPTEPTFGPARTRVDHREVDVTFWSRGTSLAGTLFLPKTGEPHPAVVWVHASGKHERLSYGDLVRAAIRANLAFFSYDKRGVGKSGGKCCPADHADAGLREFGQQADDALAAIEAVRYRPDIDAAHVGLLGVSQAGWIVPIAAARSKDVAFTVLASGPTVTTGEEQFYSGLTGDKDTSGSAAAKAARARKLREHGPSGFDPKPFLEKMTMPGLWLFGSADGSIPPDESEAVLDQLKASGKDFTYVVFPGAGHGLLDVRPPPPKEVVPTIIDWVTQKTA